MVRELPPDHALSGRALQAVAVRLDEDDVLFKVAGLGYALIRLTWSGRGESSPQLPRAQLFATIDEWRERITHPDCEP